MATRSVMKPMQVGGLRRAALREQARQPRYVTDDVDQSVRRVGRDIIACRRRGNAVPELPRDLRDIADDVYMTVVVDVRRPGVGATAKQAARSDMVLTLSEKPSLSVSPGSHASPIPLVLASACSGLATVGQLSPLPKQR